MSSGWKLMADGIHYLNLRTESPARRAALAEKFYEQIYRGAFPKSDQAEGPDTWLPLLDDLVPDGQPRIYVVLACDAADRMLGGIIFEEYRTSGCWLVTYLVVRPDARRQGVASGLMMEVVRTIGESQTKDCSVLAETENPARIADAADHAAAVERLRVLDKLGMRHLSIEYVQPALGPDKHALDDLLLLCFVPGEAPARIPAKRIAAFLNEFYAALGQVNSPYLARIASVLSKQDFLPTKRLVS
jgi:GNAT superfamily N-acetyltransferase